MVEQAKFFNIKINVEGKIHKVKIEQGVTFNSCFILENNKCIIYDENMFGPYFENENDKDFGTKIHAACSSVVKMSKDEFTIFKNLANNVKEKNNEIILSKKDFQKAEILSNEDKFETDMSHKISAGTNVRFYNLSEDKNKEKITINVGLENVIKKYCNQDIYSENIRELVAKSNNGEIKQCINISEKDFKGDIYYKYTDKKGIVHSIDADFNSEILEYSKEGCHYRELYKNNKLSKKMITDLKNNRKVREEYKDGQVTKYIDYKDSQGFYVREIRNGSDILLTKTYDNITETYQNGIIAMKKVGNNEIYTYKNGRLDSKTKFMFGRKYKFNSFGNVISFNGTGGMEIAVALIQRPSEKAKTYKEDFKHMSAKQIAKTIKSQIAGPSLNDRTIAMVDAIPAEKFLNVLKEYKKTDGIQQNGHSLFTDMIDEWNMDDWYIIKKITYAFALYMAGKKETDIKCADSEIASFLYIRPDNKTFKSIIEEIEKHITK